MSRQSKDTRPAARRFVPLLVVAALILAALVGTRAMRPAAELEPLAATVYKSSSCGCCHGWVEHLEENGFVVTTHDTEQMQEVKERRGVPAHLSSCHTAVVDGYTVEGHIPADVIRELVAKRPEVRGITVRGMPVGSPGMEQGSRREPYAVLSFDQDGQTSVFARK